MVNLDAIVKSIKENEGFEKIPYIDPLVKMDMKKENPEALALVEELLPKLKLTIGYGTLLELSNKKATVLARIDVEDVYEELKRRKPLLLQLPFEAQEVLIEMGYQMGVPGLMKFKKTWGYLEDYEFEKASVEMLDSKWYRKLHEADMLDGTDSVNRAEKLSQRMKLVK